MAAGEDPTATLQAFQQAADKRLADALEAAEKRQKDERATLETKITNLEQGMNAQENLLWLLGIGGLGVGGVGGAAVAGRRKGAAQASAPSKPA